jgi:hypothetical protein
MTLVLVNIAKLLFKFPYLETDVEVGLLALIVLRGAPFLIIRGLDSPDMPMGLWIQIMFSWTFY